MKALCKVHLLEILQSASTTNHTTIIAIIVIQFAMFFKLLVYNSKIDCRESLCLGRIIPFFFENLTFRHLVLEIYIP